MKENKQKLNGVPFDEELEIFGEHKTKEQVRTEEKERKKAEREALKQEIARRRREEKESGTVPAKRKDILVVSAVLVGIVLLCVLALGNSFWRANESRQWKINEARGHFQKADARPDMSSEGPKADVSEAYFTDNNHLCVELLFSNGTDRMVDIDTIDVAVYNYETNEMIAGGKATLPEDLIVEVAGVQSYTFYISPEHIHVDETASLPELITFEVSVTHHAVEAE